MKTRRFLLAVVCSMCQLSFAQTAEQVALIPSFPSSVDSSLLNVNAPARALTDVHIVGTNAPLYVHRSGTPKSQGMYGQFNNVYSCIEGVSDALSNGKNIGVKGYAGNSTSGQCFGIVGQIGTGNGAAIYGSSTVPQSDPSVTGRYAGYFAGQVYATEEITTPIIYTNAFLGSAASQGASVSTMSTTANTENSITASRSLSALNAYTISPMQAVVMTSNANDADDSEDETSETMAAYNSRHHHALSADEMQEVFPELVYDNADGTQSINYMELIPILVQAINDLQAEIDELKGVRSPSRPMMAPTQTTGLNTTPTTEGNSSTRYDLQGRRVKSEAKNNVIIRDGQKSIVK